jgi:hypothetical protein
VGDDDTHTIKLKGAEIDIIIVGCCSSVGPHAASVVMTHYYKKINIESGIAKHKKKCICFL